MDDPPRNFNICPSCGTEFGLNDVNASISDLRAEWIAMGTQWWSRTDPRPPNWNPFEQLARFNCGFVAAGAVYAVVSGSTSDQVLSWPGWGTTSVQPLGRSLLTEVA